MNNDFTGFDYNNNFDEKKGILKRKSRVAVIKSMEMAGNCDGGYGAVQPNPLVDFSGKFVNKFFSIFKKRTKINLNRIKTNVQVAKNEKEEKVNLQDCVVSNPNKTK